MGRGRFGFGRGWVAGGLVALAVVLVGCGAEDDEGAAATSGPEPTASTTVGSTTSTTAVGGCPASGAKVAPSGVDAAMGLRLMGLHLVNCGTQPYHVEGYPGLTLLDEDGQPFDVQVLHGAEPITIGTDGFCTATGAFDAGPQPVTLAPGEEAVALVVWRNLTEDPQKLVLAPTMSVVPAAGEAAQQIAKEGGIDLGSTGRIGVSAWAPQPPTSC